MRLALLSLTAAAIATAAVAQEAPAPAMPMAPPAAAPAPAPAPMDPMAAPAAPADPMAAPAAPMAAPAEAPPAPPPQELAPMPTDPLTLTIIDTVEKVCKPLVAGGDWTQVAKANGFAMKKKMWTKALAEKPYQIVLQNKSNANPTTCTLTIDHPIDAAQGVVSGLHAWASRQEPILQLRSPYAMEFNGMKRSTVSWETTVAGPFTGMSFAMIKKVNGQPVLKAADQSELLFQTRAQ